MSIKSLWISLTRMPSAFALGCAFACLLMSCVFLDDKKTGSEPKLDFTDATPIFQEAFPSPENLNWAIESGVDYSALGSLNPVLFERGKSPLRFPGAKLDFNLFADIRLLAVVDEVKGNGVNHFISKGHILGHEDATFLLTTHQNHISGTIRLSGMGNFNLTFTREGRYRVSKLNDYDRPELDPPIPQLAGIKINSPAFYKMAAGMGKQATREIDIAVVYDSLAAANAGGAGALKTKIVAVIDETNDIYANSGIDVELRLVDTQMVAYAESNDMSVDLSRLRTSGDGYLDTVQSIRAASKADIVTLIVNNVSGNYAGLGYVMTSIDTGFRSYAYNVLIRDALTPGWYTLAHEIGHNLGCQHDIKTTKTDGAFNYSHGWIFKGKNNVGYKTVMSYGNNTRIPYFSSPKIMYQGKPIGTTRANNAQTIQLTATMTASFYGIDSAATVSLAFPQDSSKIGGSHLMIVASIQDEGGLDSVLFRSKKGGTTTILGKVTAHPWRYFATGLDSGNHQIFVTVYDRGGHTTQSDTALVTMGHRGAGLAWTDTYLGKSGRNGALDTSGGDITLTSQGSGTVGSQDDFQFVHQAFSGNARIIAGVNSLPDEDKGRAGIMIRDTLDGSARMAFLSLGPDEKLTLATRTSRTKPAATKVLAEDVSAPIHLMLARKSTNVFAYYSADGKSWRYLTKVGIAAKGAVYAGMALTSGDSTALDSAEFSGYSADSTGNNPPVIALSGVTSGVTYNTGDSLSLSATVSDLDGATSIARVKFLQNDSVLAVDSIKPYAAKLRLFFDDDGEIEARAYDKSGDSSSAKASIILVDTNHLASNATKDTYVRNGKYTNANYGTAMNLFAQANAADGKTFRSVFSFSLAGLDTITEATLRVYGAKSVTNSETLEVEISRYSDTAWVESGSAGLKDAAASNASFITPLDTLELATANNEWFDIDVTALADSLKNDGHTAISFGMKAITATSAMAVFTSRNNTLGGGPQLILSRDTTGI